ncbi:ubiquitin 3 binding protein But2 C-terminal domain-containing protein [Xylariomycetidae sp. FL2044]|nr:ubiquitin 3 binding protein But2 C-terminal domain-containing protein [Xylariomycetidae sp. FL2044]
MFSFSPKPAALALLLSAAGGTQAMAVRTAGCDLTLRTTGAVSLTVGQHNSGQVRAGSGMSATFTLTDGTFTDSQDRGCWWTPPTHLLQCDVGQVPEANFTVGCDGLVSFNGQTTFYECVTGDGDQVNIYKDPNQGVQCAEIQLVASGCSTLDCTPPPTSITTTTQASSTKTSSTKISSTKISSTKSPSSTKAPTSTLTTSSSAPPVVNSTTPLTLPASSPAINSSTSAGVVSSSSSSYLTYHYTNSSVTYSKTAAPTYSTPSGASETYPAGGSSQTYPAGGSSESYSAPPQITTVQSTAYETVPLQPSTVYITVTETVGGCAATAVETICAAYCTGSAGSPGSSGGSGSPGSSGSGSSSGSPGSSSPGSSSPGSSSPGSSSPGSSSPGTSSPGSGSGSGSESGSGSGTGPESGSGSSGCQHAGACYVSSMLSTITIEYPGQPTPPAISPSQYSTLKPVYSNTSTKAVPYPTSTSTFSTLSVSSTYAASNSTLFVPSTSSLSIPTSSSYLVTSTSVKPSLSSSSKSAHVHPTTTSTHVHPTTTSSTKVISTTAPKPTTTTAPKPETTITTAPKPETTTTTTTQPTTTTTTPPTPTLPAYCDDITGIPPPECVAIPATCPAGGVSTAAEYNLPHLIVPIDSSQPSTALGTSFFGQVSATVSTLFNFDVPASDAGRTCTLWFLFPSADTLETSDFTFSGTGALAFTFLEGAATASTTWDSAPAVWGGEGRFDVAPGNAYELISFACPAAGSVLTVKMADVEGEPTDLSYFQDYNPCPIGLFITTS